MIQTHSPANTIVATTSAARCDNSSGTSFDASSNRMTIPAASTIHDHRRGRASIFSVQFCITSPTDVVLLRRDGQLLLDTGPFFLDLCAQGLQGTRVLK